MTKEKTMTGYASIDKPWLKYYSEEALKAEVPKCTVYEYLLECNKDAKKDTAMSYFDNRISYEEMFYIIEKAAKAFTAIGVKKGDIVVLATVTTPETIYAFYALNYIGAVSNMVDPRTSVEGIREYIEEVKASVVITIDVAYPKIAKAITGTGVTHVIVTSPADSLPRVKKALFRLVNRQKGNAALELAECLKWNDFIIGGKETALYRSVYVENTCCVIVHTGGTTGTPKGVMLSNENMNAMAVQYALMGVEFNRKQNFLNIMPPFIAYGVVLGIHMPLCLGLTDVLIPQLDPEKFPDLIIKYRPAHLAGVPTHYDKLRTSKKMRNKDLSYFETSGAGGDGMTAQFEEDINEFFQAHNCRYKIAKGYGMTEISSAASTCRGMMNKFQSVGIPHLFTTISVFEPGTDRELKAGESGEICMSAPTVMLGYYNQKEETEKVLMRHSDGKLWIHSNDIGHMDEDGFLFVEGRIKRLIIRHDGFKVFPSLIENVISSHDAVSLCCAVGMPDAEHSQGKLPIVHIVLKEEYVGKKNLIEKQLLELCLRELPEYAQPAEFVFQEKLPLTPIGKIDYRALEKMEEE
ncbi:MAG: acyl--CoA ligase [Lachnospiraceae bacterium]|nr:acyl--CoA ligase [Lachnospiraceae bacterium]